MRLPSLLRRSVSEGPARTRWERNDSDDGLLLRRSSASSGAPWRSLSSLEIDGLVDQLLDAGFAEPSDGEIRISWELEQLYDAIEDPEMGGIATILELPPVGDLTIGLRSHGALTDSDFQIAADGWLDSEGQSVEVSQHIGPVVTVGTDKQLLPRSTWNLLRRIAQFHTRAPDARTSGQNRRQWGEICSATIWMRTARQSGCDEAAERFDD